MEVQEYAENGIYPERHAAKEVQNKWLHEWLKKTQKLVTVSATTRATASSNTKE